jgi:hypothetical protein
MSGSKPQTNRKQRGGQPGNTNALSHGLYARSFKSLELSDLELALSNNLLDEIAAMKVLMQRLFVATSQVDPEVKQNNIEFISSTLDAFGMGSIRLAGLLKTQKLLTTNQGDAVTSILTEALNDVLKDLQNE